MPSSAAVVVDPKLSTSSAVRPKACTGSADAGRLPLTTTTLAISAEAVVKAVTDGAVCPPFPQLSFELLLLLGISCCSNASRLPRISVTTSVAVRLVTTTTVVPCGTFIFVFFFGGFFRRHR